MDHKVRNRIVTLAAAGVLAGGGWAVWGPDDPLHCGCLTYPPSPTEACIMWAEESVEYKDESMTRLDQCLLRREERRRQ